MIDEWPTTTDASLHDLLGELGCEVVRKFGERRDSRSVVLGVESSAGDRLIIKHAEDAEAVAWLESARRFHADVHHPGVPPVVHHIATATGLALVEEWGPGEILADGYDDTVLPPDHHESAYRRFLRLPAAEIAQAVTQLIDIHVAAVDAGYVAVDLYDGCVLYDFATGTLRLVDLDHYRPGPYVLDVDRQIGSSAYMAPEEFRRGAAIDERTTVHTHGRMALVYLGCARKGEPVRGDFRGTDRQFAVALNACAPDADDRFPTVRDLQAAWEGRHQA